MNVQYSACRAVSYLSRNNDECIAQFYAAGLLELLHELKQRNASKNGTFLLTMTGHCPRWSISDSSSSIKY